MPPQSAPDCEILSVTSRYIRGTIYENDFHLNYRYAISTETDRIKLSDIKKTMMENYLNTPADKGIESMISLDGNVVVSIIKPSENEKGVIVRLFNPTNTPEDITLNTICNTAKLVTLSEEEISPLNINNGKISLTVYPHKIETIYLEM